MAASRVLAACALAFSGVSSATEFSSFAGEATQFQQAPVAYDRHKLLTANSRGLVSVPSCVWFLRVLEDSLLTRFRICVCLYALLMSRSAQALMATSLT